MRVMPRLSIEELVAKHERAVVVGAPGSGKSTVMAFLATQVAAGKAENKDRWVPFVVPVRSLEGAVLDAESIAQTVREVDAGYVRGVLAERRGLLLVDGLDEAHGGPEKLTAGVRAFVEAYPGNRVVVTSRPAGGVGGEAVRIEGFAPTMVLPMDREDVYRFIDRWCEAAERSIQANETKALADAKKAAEDLKGRVRTSAPVEKLAQTPLLCSVVCVVHRFLGQKIPERRVALYEVCTNVLLYEWDRSKFPDGAAIGKLDAQQKRYLLGGLAHWMHEREIAEAPENEVHRIFAARLQDLPVAEDAGSLIRDIRDRSGILAERRPGFYSFSHLTFQEYLAAVEYARLKDVDALVSKYAEPWWREVIVLAAGLPDVNAATLVAALLRRERGNRGVAVATFLAAECAEASVYLPAGMREAVAKRIYRIVPPRSDEDVQRLIRLGDRPLPTRPTPGTRRNASGSCP